MPAPAPKPPGPAPWCPGNYPVLVVIGAFFRVRKDLIGLADLLELLLGGLVAGILVGMVLVGQFPIGPLEVSFGGVPMHAEQFVKNLSP